MKKTNNFTFDSRLSNDELSPVYQLLHKGLAGIQIKGGWTDYEKGASDCIITCLESCTLWFYGNQREAYTLTLDSAAQLPDFPIMEQGAVKVLVTEHPYVPVAERRPTPKGVFNGVTWSIPGFTVKQISFWGNQQKGLINELDPDINLKFLKEEYQLDYFPEVSLQSIEAIVIEAVEKCRVVLIVQESGFYVIITESSDPKELIDTYHTKGGDYRKNIVLHHLIAD